MRKRETWWPNDSINEIFKTYWGGASLVAQGVKLLPIMVSVCVLLFWIYAPKWSSWIIRFLVFLSNPHNVFHGFSINFHSHYTISGFSFLHILSRAFFIFKTFWIMAVLTWVTSYLILVFICIFWIFFLKAKEAKADRDFFLNLFLLFTFQTKARIGPGWSQELETQPVSHTWVTGLGYLRDCYIPGTWARC